MLSAPFLLAAALVCVSFSVMPVAATSYSMVKEYYGSTFFDEWSFFNNYDNLTGGNATYVSAQQATQLHLAYVDPSTNHAIIKVDNTSTVVSGNNRSSVRITTDDSFAIGSLWVADMYHVPYGCSVWPAWWSVGAKWPEDGEIDTFEGININTQNQYSLHTEPGCTTDVQNQTSTLISSTDCSYDLNGDEGCLVTDPSTASYGAGFAAASGGVFVTEFASTGINMWFFQRSLIPSSLSSNASTIDTSAFGLPVANFPSSNCNIEQYFKPQNLIFDITLCGGWAAGAWGGTCTGTCYDNWVVGDGSVYKTAYFEVSYVRVFSAAGTNTIMSSTTTLSGSSPTVSSTSSVSPVSSAPKNRDVGSPRGDVWMSTIVVFLVGLFSSALF